MHVPRLWPSDSRPGVHAESIYAHQGLWTVLFFSLLMRYYLSAWIPYWHDELLSIYYYGSKHDTFSKSLRALAETSIHPPLYQTILYAWMRVFGNGENVTHFLSNLYVAGATLCIYVLVFKTMGRRIALGAIILFSTMNMPIHYGIETRSYAQSLFLSCWSSLLLFEFLSGLPQGGSWKGIILTRQYAGLSLINLALLLTHYYNVFFLGAQGIFVLGYFLHRYRDLNIIDVLARVAVVTAMPLVLLLATWGPVMVHSFHSFEGKYAVKTEGGAPSKEPISIFINSVVRPNFLRAPIAQNTLWVLLAALLFQSVRALSRAPDAARPRYKYTIYFFIIAFAPCLWSYLLFFFVKLERFSPRYFIYCTPPFAVLLALALDNGARLIAGLVERLGRWANASRCYIRYVLIVWLVAAAVLTVPGGYRAATNDKGNLRGIADDIRDIIKRNPGDYVIYEINSRTSLDYYLSRSGKYAQHAVMPRLAKRFPTEQQANEVGRHQYLIMAFPRSPASEFTAAIKRLKKRYDLVISLLNPDACGLIVFKVRHDAPSKAKPTPPPKKP